METNFDDKTFEEKYPRLNLAFAIFTYTVTAALLIGMIIWAIKLA